MIQSYNDTQYFFGVVEDREDPKMLGRVRVRVFGLHPFELVQGDFTGLPTEELPWMQVLQSPQSPSIGGVGQAPVGPLPGTHVYGHFLDKYKINGLVIGTYYGDQTESGVEGEGFRDSSGTYPSNKGNGTPTSAQGGSVGRNSESVSIQSNTGGIGANPKGGVTKISDDPDDNPNYNIQTMLKGDEGVRTSWYLDSLGYPTIGIGHLIIHKETKDKNLINKELSKQVGRTITNGRITMEEVNKLFQKDLSIVKSNMMANPVIAPAYASSNASRKMALENMAFQLGIGGLAKFKTTLGLMAAGEYEQASKQAKESLWARQTPGRANRIALVIKTGNMESYGVLKGGPKSRNFTSFAVTSEDPDDPGIFEWEFWKQFIPKPEIPGIDLELLENEPETPYVPVDSRVMFVEPNSAYKGEYPYIQSTTTEGGHTTEYDNTPGQERFSYTHPSGTYTEIAGDGRTVNRVTGENYRIYKSHDNLLIEGDGKVVINGNFDVYIMGDEINTVDGDSTSTYKGNITVLGAKDYNLKLEGNSTVNIIGNSDIHVEGNADIHVEGNGSAVFDGNYDTTVKGNMTTTVEGTRIDKVKGNWTRNSESSVSDTASSNFLVDANRIDLGK